MKRVRPVLNSSQMKAADNRTSEYYGIKPEILMEKAALKIIDYISHRFGQQVSVLLIAGPGNNGADAVAAFRLLMQNGYNADLFIVPSDKYSPLMEMQTAIVRRYNYRINNILPEKEYDIIVDGLFGIGINRPVNEPYTEIIQYINDADATVISVDVPSGLNADTGAVMGSAVRADITITFNYLKSGMLTSNGVLYSGKILVKDIGITEESLCEKPDIFFLERCDVALPKRERNVNKGSCGKLVIIAGNDKICGAMSLSAMAAMRIGAGMVKVITHVNNKATLETLLPDVLAYYYDSHDTIDKEELIKECAWADAILIGPGIGKDTYAANLLKTVINDMSLPLIVDADGINVLAENDNLLNALKEKQDRDVILTPHLKEFERISGVKIAKIKEDIYTQVKKFLKEYPFTMVIKDAVTLIADRKEIWINSTGNQALAKAGTGDVLAGMIAGLAVQEIKKTAGNKKSYENVGMINAAKCGVYLHGYMADKLVEESLDNYYSLMASDLCEAMKRILGEF